MLVQCIAAGTLNTCIYYYTADAGEPALAGGTRLWVPGEVHCGYRK